MKTFIAALFLFFPATALAWDGTDAVEGGMVEIEKGEYVRPGQTIEVYDHETGQYHMMDVYDMYNVYGGTTIEAYDYETGETRYLDMD